STRFPGRHSRRANQVCLFRRSPAHRRLGRRKRLPHLGGAGGFARGLLKCVTMKRCAERVAMENPLARDLDHVLSHTEELWAPVRGERFFLTGGTGFVGTWLTESLLWANRRLSLGISAVLLTRHPEAFRQRSPHLAGDPAVTLWAGDGATFSYPD